MIVYVKLEISIHGLSIESEARLNFMIDEIRNLIGDSYLPVDRADGGIEIDVIEHAGQVK